MIPTELLTRCEAVGVPAISEAARELRPVALASPGMEAAALPDPGKVLALIRAVAEWADKAGVPAAAWRLLMDLIRASG